MQSKFDRNSREKREIIEKIDRFEKIKHQLLAQT